ncbi:vWA domain-containing protein [Phocaeicola coprophilus]|uniref:vWA domain-containing protein n=1 Tax=Phocaeicola coprophilus TaxID=387090 RepID=UPI0039F5996F
MMNNKSSEQRMQYYSETFDFYMDSEDHPDFEPANDILGQYIQSVVADNPQLDSQNPLWTEILKDDLMRFLQALLSLYEPIEKEHDKQSKMIYAFTKANMNGKRKMWNVVSQTIKQFYAAQEVNIEGYINQMQQMDEESKSMVLSVLAKDWEKANDEYMERIEKEILDKNKNIWECSVRDHGIEDYERVRKIEHVFYRYPALTEIVKIIGREQPENKKEQDDILFKYKPLIVSNHMTFKEVEEITTGRNLSHLVPTEIAFLADSFTESVFYQKFTSYKLQLFSNRSKILGQEKTKQQICDKPRLQIGPIIVAVDTSESMYGQPEKIANSLLIQLVRMAKKQRRKCFLVTFSVKAQTIDLAHPANWDKLKDFLDHGFSGGTNGEEMLKIALRVLETETYSLADILIISDFEFSKPIKNTIDKMCEERAMGVRFYGLQIGTASREYDKILDRIWKV